MHVYNKQTKDSVVDLLNIILDYYISKADLKSDSNQKIKEEMRRIGMIIKKLPSDKNLNMIGEYFNNIKF